MKNKITDKKIDDIYILTTTAQFLLDFIDENFIHPSWAGNDLKSTLKTTMAKLQRLASIPFVEVREKATAEMAEQHITGSYLAEQSFRIALKFDKMSDEDKMSFQTQYETLMSSYNLLE